MTGWLHDEAIGAAHIFQQLDIALAVGETRHVRLAERDAKKSADLRRQRRVRCAAKDLQLLIQSSALHLALSLGLRVISLLWSNRRSRLTAHVSRRLLGVLHFAGLLCCLH